MIWGNGYGIEVDFWALGCLLHEGLFGVSPFVSESTKTMFTKVQRRALPRAAAAAAATTTSSSSSSTTTTVSSISTTTTTATITAAIAITANAITAVTATTTSTNLSHKILSGKIQPVPDCTSKSCRSLLLALLKGEPADRIDAKGLRAHSFFAKYSWEEIFNKTVRWPSVGHHHRQHQQH